MDNFHSHLNIFIVQSYSKMCRKNYSIIFVLFEIILNQCDLTKCGRVKRVVGGIEVECGIKPRVVSLRNASNHEHLCGATLLSPEFALTTAHCVNLEQFSAQKPSEYMIQLNNYCCGDQVSDEPPTAEILAIIRNELYDKVTRAHDIALLQIKLNLKDASWLHDDILSTSSFGLSGECILYGYGYQSPDVAKPTDYLQSGKLEIVSLDDCTNILGPFVAPKYDAGMLCALGHGVDACQGDSGSPLFCDGGKLEAISSYGMSCGVPGLPGVYTSVGQHIHWIRQVMET